MPTRLGRYGHGRCTATAMVRTARGLVVRRPVIVDADMNEASAGGQILYSRMANRRG